MIKVKFEQQGHCIKVKTKLGDVGGSTENARDAPPGPIFLHFHGVFGKNWSNSRLSQLPPPPPVGEGGVDAPLGNPGSNCVGRLLVP